jgi:hypothetical protein
MNGTQQSRMRTQEEEAEAIRHKHEAQLAQPAEGFSRDEAGGSLIEDEVVGKGTARLARVRGL